MNLGDGPPGSLGRFAAGVIGLKSDDPGAEIPALLLRKLLNDDFLPDPVSHEAMLVLAGKAIGPGSLLAEEATRAEECRLHAEIEQFAAEFFAIPIVSRGERWQALAQASAHHPRLIERLRTLKPGLGIDREAVMVPSPAMKRLLDDIFALFPLRPGSRAVESRDRLRTLESDPAFKEVDLHRTLKLIQKRHPQIAALSHGYLEQMARPGRSIAAGQAKAQVAHPILAKGDLQQISLSLLLLIAGCLCAKSVLTRTSPSSPPVTTPANVPQPYLPPNLTAPPEIHPPLNFRARPKSTLPPTVIHLALRDELKGRIREQVARTGRTIHEAQLKVVGDGLPVEELPPVGGLATLVLKGHWTEKVHARFVDRLKEGLKATGLELDDEELDDLARKCFPSPVVSQNPSTRGSP